MKKRLISALMATALAASIGFSALAVTTDTPATTTTTTTTLPADVQTTAWYKDAAQYVLDSGLMENVNGKFDANAQMTREQIAKSLAISAKAAGVTATGSGIGAVADYAQISADAVEGVTFCYNAGIMAGDDKCLLNPKANVTRAELSKMLTVYAQKMGIAATGTTDIKKFTDYAQIKSWAYDYVTYCVNSGMVKGDDKGAFNPAGNITRAQFAQIMLNNKAQTTPTTTTTSTSSTSTTKATSSTSTTTTKATSSTTTTKDTTSTTKENSTTTTESTSTTTTTEAPTTSTEAETTAEASTEKTTAEKTTAENTTDTESTPAAE